MFEAIRQLIAAEEKPKRKIGFEVREARAGYRTVRVGMMARKGIAAVSGKAYGH